MSEKDWQTFFTLIQKIMDLPGTWQEKKQAVLAEIQSDGDQTMLEEFVGWFVE